MQCRTIAGISRPACVIPDVCGNGILEPDQDEECDGDDGPQPCSSGCHQERCGNGTLEPDLGEQCDDGVNNGPGKRCDHQCKFNFCGNGVVDLGEQCDDGVDGEPRDSAICDHDCTFRVCGDSYPNTTAGEDCDDGDKNGSLDDTCDAFCHFNRCGNGYLDATEQCDPNPPGSSDPPVNTSSCNSDCRFPVCGDGLLNEQAGEQCDQGSANGDPCPYGQETCSSCDHDCHPVVASGPFCGDHQINGPVGGPLEVCDQGELNGVLDGVPCDYGNPFCMRCNATCTGSVSPGGPFCGDGITQMSFYEQCDPATGPSTSSPLDPPSRLAKADSTTCNIDCTLVVCGDGYLNAAAGETCDDGNQLACGTCPATPDTDCRGAMPITPSPATSTIMTTGGDQIGDGDTLTLDDGFGTMVTFEFTLSGTPQDGAHIAITFARSPATDAATIASRMVDAINTKAPEGFLITASVPMNGTTVTLTNTRKSLFGNTDIGVTGQIGIAGGFTFSASPPKMTGGLAGDCLTGTGCVFADDCKSGVCNATTHQCQ